MSASPVAATLPADGPVITGWSAVSAHGLSRREFADGVRSGLAAARTEPEGKKLPRPDACLVPDLDRPGLLGQEYSYTLDRLAIMSLLATDQLLVDADGGPVPRTDDRTGVVMGTTMGGKESMAEVIRGSLTNARPFYVDVGLIPGCVMNHSAGAAAIRHGLRGPNATVGGGRVSGLLALNYARRLLDQGRADNCLVGSGDEFSPTNSWLEQAAGTPGEPAPLLGEGCGLLLLEPAGTNQLPPLASVLAVATAIDVDDDPQATVDYCARRAMERAGVAPEEVWAAVTTAVPTPEGIAERAALAELVPAEALDRIPSMALLGDTGAASASLQIAALLVVAGEDPTAAGRVALVSAVDRDGTAAVAVLRLLEVTS
ncbi:beta-ketoacyl synthase N-terminal-like domain-containing protein [Streptomyces sp. NRRL WC-3742]|uniref:beta-ketoacyl synthase N-terminal-like domain-containing protein n=1 Tax=Streptomyces sp. NRRL WC-3742 TaxID=1463934 RepID=UPI000AA64733|nr:beta-ketoacyl synthase N-terminal-like domain-containing protein [Streptomyces sp. NRRL WC-3742]